MLTAIRTSDKTKVIGDLLEKDKNETYLCEYCENVVVHHKSESKIKVGHFKHKAGGSFCPNTGETIDHIQTKMSIYKYILEKWGEKLKIVEPEKWIYVCSGSCP